VHWYTTMVGRKATLKAVKQDLLRHRVPALRVTEFAQGRTSRWGIAWSFSAAAQATERAPLPRTDAHPRPLLAKWAFSLVLCAMMRVKGMESGS